MAAEEETYVEAVPAAEEEIDIEWHRWLRRRPV
jgi:hypothetical protein